MKNTGTLRIQTFAARQSAPVEGVTVAVQGDGFTLHRITDATGSAADIPIEAPACALSLDEDNTTRPYAIVSLTAAKPGYRTVRIEGIARIASSLIPASRYCTRSCSHFAFSLRRSLPLLKLMCNLQIFDKS